MNQLYYKKCSLDILNVYKKKKKKNKYFSKRQDTKSEREKKKRKKKKERGTEVLSLCVCRKRCVNRQETEGKSQSTSYNL